MFEDPEYLRKRNGFDAALNAIEQKYLYWFEQRPALFDGDKHDRLGNHTNFYRKPYSVEFWINNNSEMPAMIQDECMAVFCHWFGQDEQ